MNAVFADTSYYFSILNPRDQFHAAATQISLQLSQRIVTEWSSTLDETRRRQDYLRSGGFAGSIRIGGKPVGNFAMSDEDGLYGGPPRPSSQR